MRKRMVRATVFAARRAMPAADRTTADGALVAGAVELARGCRTVTAYVPMRAEPGGPGLLDALAEVVPTVLLPVLRSDLDLTWAAYAGPGSLALPPMLVGPSGSLQEPTGRRLGPAAVSRADLVLVSAVAVDFSGLRLGRGGGSFDRALVRVRAGTAVVALLYEGELLESVPAEPHDRRVTAALLPSGLVALPREA